MGRPETPLDPAGPASQLAQELRELRAAQGLTYKQLKDVAFYDCSSLSRAACGTTVPSWSVTEAYIRGCTPAGAPEPDWDRWKALHSAALREQEGATP